MLKSALKYLHEIRIFASRLFMNVKNKYIEYMLNLNHIS